MTGSISGEADLRHWLIDYLVTNIGCTPDEVDPDLSLADLGVSSATRSYCPANCQSCWAGPYRRLTSGSTRRSTRWPRIWPHPSRAPTPTPQSSVVPGTHSTSQSPSSAWDVVSLAGFRAQKHCGTFSVNAVPRSARCRRNDGSPSKAGHPR